MLARTFQSPGTGLSMDAATLRYRCQFMDAIRQFVGRAIASVLAHALLFMSQGGRDPILYIEMRWMTQLFPCYGSLLHFYFRGRRRGMPVRIA